MDSTINGAKQLGVYFQDDWRVKKNFTLNLGVRWDKDINFFCSDDLAKSRVYTALKAINNQYAGVAQPPSHSFSPRFGFAWDIGGTGKNVIRGGYGLFWDESLQGNVWDAVALGKPNILVAVSSVNSGVGVGQLANYVFNVSPLPPGPLAITTQLPAGARTAGRWIAPDYSVPYNHQFHIGYARQISPGQVFSADFTHIHGLNEFRGQEINPIEGPWDPNAAAYNTCGAAPGYRRLQCAFQRTLGDGNLLGSITMQTTRNRSRDDEAIFHYERRLQKMTFQASYILGWAYGYGGSIGAIGGGGTPTPQPVNQDSFFGTGEWGPAITDERQRLVLSGIFDLKWGIQASPVFQAGSPRPYTLTAGSDLNVDGINNDRYIDPTTGKMVAANSQRGDSTYNLDLRLTKFFNLRSEQRKIGVFAEFYNLTNKANFGNLFQGNARSPLFKQPGGPGAFGTGYLAGLPTSRQLQLGLRFTF